MRTFKGISTHLLNAIKNNGHYIFPILVYTFYRFYALGISLVHNDAFYFKYSSYLFYQNLKHGIPNLFITIQPGVPTVYFNIIGYLTVNLIDKLGIISVDIILDSFILHVVQKFYSISFGILLLVILMFYLSRFSKKFTVILVILLSVEPLFILHSRVIQTDMLQALLLFVSILFLSLYLKYSNPKYLYFCAVFTSLSFLEKSPSIVILPFVFLLLLLKNYLNSKQVVFSFFRSLKEYVLYILLFGVLSYAIYPAFWYQPSVTLKGMTIDLFLKGIRGVEVDLGDTFTPHANGLSYYFVYAGIKFSTTYLLGILIGIWKYAIDFRKKNSSFLFQFVSISTFFGLYYLSFLLIGEKKIGRYIIIPATLLLPLVGYGYYRVLAYFKKIYYVAILFIFIFFSTYVFFTYFPNLGVYKNVMAKALNYKLSKDAHKEFIDGGTGLYAVAKFVESKYGYSYTISTPRHKGIEMFYSGSSLEFDLATLPEKESIVVLPKDDQSTSLIIALGYHLDSSVIISEDLEYYIYIK